MTGDNVLFQNWCILGLETISSHATKQDLRISQRFFCLFVRAKTSLFKFIPRHPFLLTSRTRVEYISYQPSARVGVMLGEQRLFVYGGRLPDKKDGGCSSEILKRTPKMYQDPVLWAWLEIVFSPMYQFLHNTSVSPVIFFGLNCTLEGTSLFSGQLVSRLPCSQAKTAPQKFPPWTF